MKDFLSLNSFSVRLLLGFMVFIGLITLIAGLPVYWLTRNQLERQAWSQVASARVATQSLLAAEQVAIDMVQSSQDGTTQYISFTLPGSEWSKAEALLNDAYANARLRPTHGVGKISLLGVGIGQRPALVATALRALHQQGIELLQLCQGELRLSAVVRRSS